MRLFYIGYLLYLLTNVRVYFSTSVSEHSACKTLIYIKEIIQLNRKVALNKVKYTLSTSRERRGENSLITDAVYRCGEIRHDKSLTVNCLVLFMTYWHKVQMSCRQTQPVVLRRGVRFRHGSLFLHQASRRVLVCTRALWNRNRGLCCHISCWHLPFIAVSFVFGQFGESLTNTNLTSSRAFAITWTWRHFTNADGWHELNDSRSAM